MSLEIPKLEPKNFETAKGLSRVTDDIHDLLYGHYPALMLTGVSRVEHGHKARSDIIFVRQVLDTLGFNILERRQANWGIIRKDEGWHVDRQQEEAVARGHYYPNIEYLSLRRHTAVRGAAQAAFRTTLFAQYGTTGFKHDAVAPAYEALQQPGDSLYFMSSGGVHENFQIPQAEHRFTTVGTTPRQIHVLDFDFAPK